MWNSQNIEAESKMVVTRGKGREMRFWSKGTKSEAFKNKCSGGKRKVHLEEGSCV